MSSMSAVQALEAIETRVVEVVEASAAVADMLSTATAPGTEAQPEERKLLDLCNQVLTNAKVRGLRGDTMHMSVTRLRTRA